MLTLRTESSVYAEYTAECEDDLHILNADELNTDSEEVDNYKEFMYYSPEDNSGDTPF